MKNKMAALFMCAAMTLGSLSGCGSADETTSDVAETASAAASDSGTEAGTSADSADLKVAMCMSHQTNDFQITVTSAAIEKGKELGIEVVVFDGNNDSATQISQIESAVDQGYDGIIFEPINVDAVQNIVDYANQEGVPVVNVVGAMSDWENYAAAYVGGDNVTAGEMEMRKVAELLDGKGNIAILNGPMGSDPQIQRHEGYDKVLAEYPDLVVTNEDDAQWATDKALNITENWLQSGKEINAIVCQNDGMAVGAAKAVSDAGLDGIIVTGIDATSDGIEAIKSGSMTGTVSQDAAGQGSLSVETMHKVMKGETLEKNDLHTENIWIDSSNVNE